MAEPEERIVIGKIVSAHGLRGEVKMSLFVDDAAFLRDVKSLQLEGRVRQEVELQAVRFHGPSALLTLAGVTERNGAEALRGREVSVPFSVLPELEEDEYYVAELVGLNVQTTEGEPLGTLAEVIFTGANEVYVVRGGPRGEILLPAIASVVQEVDLDGDRMVVTLPEGLVE